MSLTKQEKMEFQLVNIEILDSLIKAPKEPLPNDVIFSFDITQEQRINVEKEFVIVICDIKTFPQGNTEIKLGRFRSSCIFKVKDLKNFISKENKINLPEDFIITVNSVAISTTRGLMFSLFNGTFLQGALLPLVNPSQFIPKDK